MESLAYFLIGVIIGFLLGMFKARKWWLAYNGGYGAYDNDLEDLKGEKR